MTSDRKLSIATLEKAMGEYRAKGVVEDAQCERCGSVLRVTSKSGSVLLVECDCGTYNDTIRGL